MTKFSKAFCAKTICMEVDTHSTVYARILPPVYWFQSSVFVFIFERIPLNYDVHLPSAHSANHIARKNSKRCKFRPFCRFYCPYSQCSQHWFLWKESGGCQQGVSHSHCKNEAKFSLGWESFGNLKFIIRSLGKNKLIPVLFLKTMEEAFFFR